MEKKVPRLRTDIDIIPSSYQGEKVFLVKDFLGLIPQPVLLRGAALQLIGLIDGMRSIQDIQVELIRLQRGVFVRGEDVEDMISQLDKAFLIDSHNYRRGKKKIIEEYRQRQIREACLAGTAYPDNPDELAPYIQSILDTENGQPNTFGWEEISAIVAPHIDLDIGKKVYAKAYQVVKGLSPERILLLGTGHHLSESYISLTTKDFVTPFGQVKTDRDEVEKLKEKCSPEIIAPNDIHHKNEHSLEFQILFLQHMFGNGFRLMPVLCGSLHKEMRHYSKPEEIPGMSDFISGLRLYLGDRDKKKSALIVAGVDFSHIGPKFGHREPATSLLLEAKEHDSSLLDAICQGDVTAFWAEVWKENNKYNVCGFSTLALLLELLSGRTGCVLGYDFWMEEATQSAVSYAALAFPAV
ncbi:MAG: AmmeMemoRadiSam system protein B [Candidatus Aminicenantes bacterium]|nr:MAG: AmmeMemoRadiSam system protein B [Candidatus Aminicenantes bacterium]